MKTAYPQFSPNKETAGHQAQLNNMMKNPYSEGGTAEYSSWGIYHSALWKIRLPLMEAMVELRQYRLYDVTKDLSFAVSLMYELSDFCIGVFSTKETNELEEQLDALAIKIDEFIIRKKSAPQLMVDGQLISEIRTAYKLLASIQQKHNLLLPIDRFNQNLESMIEANFTGN